MKVKNISGTSDKTCKCESWLSHWERFSGRNSFLCTVLGCFSAATLGAHVQKSGSLDQKHYIVPFCSSHNSSTSVIELERDTMLVSANVAETCG